MLQQWIGEKVRQPGIRGFGLRLPDATCFSHSFAPECDEQRLNETWHSFNEVLNALRLQGIPATRLRWSYNQGFLYFAVRRDGVSLGLVAARSSERAVADAMDRLLTEFIAFEDRSSDPVGT
jgi:hypothetical protein